MRRGGSLLATADAISSFDRRIKVLHICSSTHLEVSIESTHMSFSYACFPFGKYRYFPKGKHTHWQTNWKNFKVASTLHLNWQGELHFWSWNSIWLSKDLLNSWFDPSDVMILDKGLFINDVIIFGGYPRFSLQTTHVLKVHCILSTHGWSEVNWLENKLLGTGSLSRTLTRNYFSNRFLPRPSRIKRFQVRSMGKFGPTAPNLG